MDSMHPSVAHCGHAKCVSMHRMRFRKLIKTLGCSLLIIALFHVYIFINALQHMMHTIIRLIAFGCYSFIPIQIENRALRLRENSSPWHYVEDASPPSSSSLAHPSSTKIRTSSEGRSGHGLSWDYFDEMNYIRKGSLRTGEDPYVRNRFNQQASDQLASNRVIPDTRNQVYVNKYLCERKTKKKNETKLR